MEPSIRRKYSRRPPAIPLVIIMAFLTIALIGPYITPHDPFKGDLAKGLRPPCWIKGGSIGHVLGTDDLGRDLLSRVLAGAMPSAVVSLIAIFIAGFFGASFGLISGYLGGKADAIMMRVADIMLSLPTILVAFILAVAVGGSMFNIIVILALILWARYARQIRGEVLSVRERDFVALARIVGCSPFRIMLRHIFPNVANTLIVMVTLQVGWVIVLEASLSFLGVGIPPPEPSWGLMVSEGRGLLRTAWWISLFPGLGIFLVVISFNLLGDWLRDALDPKLRQI